MAIIYYCPFDLAKVWILGPPQSDTALLHELVRSCSNALSTFTSRDPTCGGVSAVLHEAADATGLSFVIDEQSVPLSEPVRGACELLGLDPLHVSNEGKPLLIVAPADEERTLACLKQHAFGTRATAIGEVLSTMGPNVLVRGPLGALRVLDEPTGAPLPRIC